MDYQKINKKWWDDITPVHSASKLYNVNAFKKGHTSLQPLELKEMGNVKGKTMLHLLCHFGMDSLSWAREGAIVTGVDISEKSIELAKRLSIETKTPAKFICADVFDTPKLIHEKFDIVFMSYGVLLWLSDIKKWAKLVSNFLKKGGTFYMVELHPFTSILDNNVQMVYDYFDKGPFEDDASGTYTDWTADIQGVTYEWSYTMADVINAFIDVGMKLEYVHEFPYTMYDQFPGHMKQNKKGQYVLKTNKYKIPLLFSIKATK